MDGYETLLPYYQRELGFLRREGADFARQYPQIARRLDVAGDTVTDPDVERLIESVAFLTARIQHVIDQEFPIIPTAMLDILYPQFSTPIPSMAIAQFRPPEEAGKLTTGLTVERGRQFFAASGEKGAPVVRFRTCYPATIWPLQPSYAGFDDSYPEIVQAERARSLFRLRLRSTGPGFAAL
ncbi:type VI secretion system baseplate subunit TssF, partial [Oceanibaculum nanhaiense]|uniref:type VI secretion system baseplate subunit TssF n=1 Tax=Oceanibaculum nanhaiense TaxID=1909734 RepID=UPI00396F1BF3